MKIKFLFFTVFCLFCAVPMMADNDVLITRDGTMISVKIGTHRVCPHEFCWTQRSVPMSFRRPRLSVYSINRNFD